MHHWVLLAPTRLKCMRQSDGLLRQPRVSSLKVSPEYRSVRFQTLSLVNYLMEATYLYGVW